MTAKKVVAVFFLWASSGCTLAQNFPSKPIRIIVPTIAGSAPDVRVRQIAPKLSDAVGQSVIVDNRPGANGTIATQLAARATPDGHTLFYGLINNAINDALHPDSCCRLNQELVPVVHFTSTPLVMVVHPSVAANTLQEYLQLAKAKPGLLTYASAGPGSITQLLGEWISRNAEAITASTDQRVILWMFQGTSGTPGAVRASASPARRTARVDRRPGS